MIVEGERVARFVSAVLGFGLCPPYTALGIEQDGEVTAGVIFHCFEGKAVHVTAAGTGWTLGFMRALGEYVFGQLGCERMTLTTEKSEVAEYALRLGGEREGVLRNQYGLGRNGIVVGVLRREWKFGKFAPD